MNPNEFAVKLRRIASKINNSGSPVKNLIISDLKSLVASLHLADGQFGDPTEDQFGDPTEEQIKLFGESVDKPLSKWHAQDVFERSELKAKHPIEKADIYITFSTCFLNDFDKPAYLIDMQDTQYNLSELFDEKAGEADFYVLISSGDSDGLWHYDCDGGFLDTNRVGDSLPDYNVRDLVKEGVLITNKEFVIKANEFGFKFDKYNFRCL